MKRLFAALIIMVIMQPVSAANYAAGFEYKRIAKQETSTTDKIEVLEFFWYGCPHCFRFEPFMKRWLANKPKNVEFIRVPAPLNPSWMIHSKAYYALELMGQLDKVHDKLFDAMHLKRMRLFDEESVVDFVAKQGVDRQQFIDTMKSFAVSSKVNKAKQLVKEYKLTGVPEVAINGKYTTNARMAGGYKEMIEIMDYLIDKEAKSLMKK